MRDLAIERAIIVMHADEEPEEYENDEYRHPSALPEFGDDDDDGGSQGSCGADGIEGQGKAPVTVLYAPPMPYHAGLGHRESAEGADREERDEPIRNAFERKEQNGGKPGESEDPHREDQPAANIREGRREKTVPCQEAASQAGNPQSWYWPRESTPPAHRRSYRSKSSSCPRRPR